MIMTPKQIEQRQRFARSTDERLAHKSYAHRVSEIPRRQLKVLADASGIVDCGRETATRDYIASLHEAGDRTELVLDMARKGLAKLAGKTGKARDGFVRALVDDLDGINALVVQLAGVAQDLDALLSAQGVDVAYEVDQPGWRGSRCPDHAGEIVA